MSNSTSAHNALWQGTDAKFAKFVIPTAGVSGASRRESFSM